MPDVYKKIVLYNIYTKQKTGYTFSIKMNAASCILTGGCSQWTENTEYMEEDINESSDRNRFFERQFKFY